ncbi:hypothetical protein [Microbulbifer sp. THAF38]|uniref:hypothetical protein n=1 Tax=Microbulbifer sp. THAF38 TaxID=2587856 RepID=UPI00126926C2|nr:hypothetical protein [Microbulbifer sp. THAF38]QFT54090.1 hypothetical protein FIU95_05875 [Microbulbifer sp. THAF38]
MKYAYMLAVLLLVGVGLPMIIPGPDGKPIMSPQDWLPDQQTLDSVRQQGQRAFQAVSDSTQKSAEQLETLVESSGLLPEEQNKPTREVFSWQDSEGNWHFSDSIPEGMDADVRIHQVKPINTLPASQTVSDMQPQEPQAQPLQENSGSENRITQILKEVQALKEKSQQRQQALDNL